MIILIDQDAVLADFERGFLIAWQEKYPARDFIPLAERTTFYVEDQYPEEFRSEIVAIKETPGFFRNLPIMAYAAAALGRLIEMGHEVFVCTSPVGTLHCVTEKLEWVEEHLGMDMLRRTIITRDKTLVHGDILIDDRPKISGLYTPSWKHWLFDTPNNHHLVDVLRVNWETIPTLLRA